MDTARFSGLYSLLGNELKYLELSITSLKDDVWCLRCNSQYSGQALEWLQSNGYMVVDKYPYNFSTDQIRFKDN